MPPTINWDSPWVWAIVILTCIHLAIHAATFAAICVLLLKKAKSNVSKGAKALSALLSKWGFSSNVTAIVDDVANGDALAFASDGLKEVQYLHDPSNRAKEWQSFVSTGLADPVVGPPLTKWLQDKLAGASSDVLAADALATVKAIDSGIPVLPMTAHFDQLMHVVDSIHAGNTSMADLTNLFATNPATAPISGFVTKLVALGHDMGTAAAATAAKLAPVALATGALALPAAAPALIPAAAAAAAANSGVTVTGLMEGHNVEITAVPGSPAAAAAVASA